MQQAHNQQTSKHHFRAVSMKNYASENPNYFKSNGS